MADKKEEPVLEVVPDVRVGEVATQTERVFIIEEKSMDMHSYLAWLGNKVCQILKNQ